MSQAPATYDVGDAVVLTSVFTINPTVGSISANTKLLFVQDPSGYAVSDALMIEGAGAVDGDLYAVVQNLQGSLLTLDVNAGTAVAYANVGKLTTPSPVTCKVKLPDGTTSTLSTTNPSLGKFQAVFTCTKVGDHYVRWTGAGAAVGVGEKQFLVRDERV